MKKKYTIPVILELGEMTAEGYDIGILGTCVSPGLTPGKPGVCNPAGSSPQ